jgi:hypothetical protein
MNQIMDKIKFEEKFKAKKLIESEIDFKEFFRALDLQKKMFFSLFDEKLVRISFSIQILI